MGIKQKKEKRGAPPARPPTLMGEVSALDAALSRRLLAPSRGPARAALLLLELLGSGWLWIPGPIAYLLSGYATVRRDPRGTPPVTTPRQQGRRLAEGCGGRG